MLDHILVQEAMEKKKHAVAKQIQTSGFPFHKSLESFDFDFQPSIDKRR